jgi:glucan 1,3-beta-glucosidase
MENGSGGFMGGMSLYQFYSTERYSCHFSDLVFNGGKFGMSVGNQQFTVRNITINKANVAVNAIWNWGS